MNLLKRLGKWTAVIVVLVAIGLVGGGMMLSPAFTVTRSVLVNAPPEKVYAFVADPRGWKQWSVWNQRDPAMAITGEQSFAAWGWRIPFLLAVIPLAISVWMRLRLTESPVFLEMKRKGMLSRSPLRDVFSDRKTVRTMVIVLFGLVAGQAVLGYGGQLYPYLFMLTVLKIDAFTATVLTAWAMAVTCVGFIVFGWLSDLIGRKPVIVAGLILAVATIFPLFHALAGIANPDLERAQRSVAITVASPADCAFQFNPAGTARYGAPCDKVRSLLAAKGAQFASARAVETSVTIGSTRIEGGDPDLAAKLTAALKAAGYPDPGSPGVVEVRSLGDILHPQALAMIAILSILGLYSAMVYAPLAAYLVELFPPQIRTTALSLPYHIGNGWIGGLLPPTAVALVIATGNPYAGLWYPVTFAALSAVVSVLFLRGRDDRGEG